MKEDIFSEKLKLDFCNRLRSLRNQRGISAREMSLSLGQNVNYINLIENGKRLPSMEGFFLVCEFFDLTPSMFFAPEGEVTTGKASPTHQEILAVFEHLNDRQRNSIIECIRNLME
ncbi:MAG: helix-turn-helix transcriptional regulator [Spirochaetaceae bacterium]|nr:helix-turn-helix transcriptional regulator [Spirochaetaceae bacterium]